MLLLCPSLMLSFSVCLRRCSGSWGECGCCGGGRRRCGGRCGRGGRGGRRGRGGRGGRGGCGGRVDEDSLGSDWGGSWHCLSRCLNCGCVGRRLRQAVDGLPRNARVVHQNSGSEMPHVIKLPVDKA